ncbi:MAG: hypothetical protein EHM58_19775 [Ignavibacteriae bacterium]|nr:MAG: hypothetical protein EHM58_19775 [Ignavibacteriota bacterium]
MKEFNKVVLHILFWITVPLTIFYFKWAAQETTSLPGLPSPVSENYFDIVSNNLDVIIVSLLGSIPFFYLSLFFLTPKLLYKRNCIKIALYISSVLTYSFVVVLFTDLFFPMYYFFGTPYAIKVLIPIVLLSGFGGTLFAFNEKLQGEKK